jgi:hypothetical protein
LAFFQALKTWAQNETCAWRIVISQATGQEQCYIPSLDVGHFKGALNCGQAQPKKQRRSELISSDFLFVFIFVSPLFDLIAVLSVSQNLPVALI